jgi:hypothetical protein
MVQNSTEQKEGNWERLRSVKDLHEADLMSKANVVGVGIGLRQRAGQSTGEPAIVVSVTHKVPSSLVHPDDVIPSELDGIPVDVQEIGRLRAL